MIRERVKTYLGEKSIETVDLLSFFDIGIILGDTSKRKFIHEINFVRGSHVLVLTMKHQHLPPEPDQNEVKKKFTLNVLTIMGKVALKSMTWRSEGR